MDAYIKQDLVGFQEAPIQKKTNISVIILHSILEDTLSLAPNNCPPLTPPPPLLPHFLYTFFKTSDTVRSHENQIQSPSPEGLRPVDRVFGTEEYV